MKHKKVGLILAVCLGISCSVFAMKKKRDDGEEKIQINVEQESFKPVNSFFKDVVGLSTKIFVPQLPKPKLLKGDLISSKIIKTVSAVGITGLMQYFRYLVMKNDHTFWEPTVNCGAYGSIPACGGYLGYVWGGKDAAICLINLCAKKKYDAEKLLRQKTLKSCDKELTKLYNKGGKMGEEKYNEACKTIEKKMNRFSDNMQLNISALMEMFKPTSFEVAKEKVLKRNGLKMIKKNE